MLFIDLTGFPDAVEGNLIEIVAGIGGFGDISIVVTGVDSRFITPEGELITDDAGITFCDADVIRVIYDVRQCNFSGYYVFDTNGNKISLPNYILLGHELSHALHIANGDHACPHLLGALGKAAAEVVAEVDENSLRSRFGEDLRDVQKSAHADAALELSRLQDLRRQIEECCPPPIPEPACRYEPCWAPERLERPRQDQPPPIG
jgi:hypothetical protein